MGWRPYLTLGRISNLPTVWTNVLAGTVLAGVVPSLTVLLLLALSLSLFYTGGMYLNDAFDRKVDARERPERPIPSGAVSARRVFALGSAMLLAALLLLTVAAVPGARAATLLSGVSLAAVIVLYDTWHKRNPVGPVIMGVARALVYVTAAVAVSGRVTLGVIAAALVLLAYLIGLTYAAKQESLGRIGNLWPLLFLAIPFVYAAPALLASATGVGLYLGFLAWVVYALTLLIRPPRRIPTAVVSLIAGISLLDATLIALEGEAILAAAAAVGFAMTLAMQRLVPGT